MRKLFQRWDKAPPSSPGFPGLRVQGSLRGAADPSWAALAIPKGFLLLQERIWDFVLLAVPWGFAGFVFGAFPMPPSPIFKKGVGGSISIKLISKKERFGGNDVDLRDVDNNWYFTVRLLKISSTKKKKEIKWIPVNYGCRLIVLVGARPAPRVTQGWGSHWRSPAPLKALKYQRIADVKKSGANLIAQGLIWTFQTAKQQQQNPSNISFI